LVGAGGGTAIATYALQPGDDFFAFHPLHESPNALEVAIAAAGEDGRNHAVVVIQHNVNGGRACANAVMMDFFHRFQCIKGWFGVRNAIAVERNFLVFKEL
jgi:hypothetical protein